MKTISRLHFVLYLASTLSGFARGAYLVSVGWSALVISNDVATVGQIFIVAFLTILLSGSFIGILVDKYNRRLLAVIGQAVIISGMVSFSIPGYLNIEPSLLHLFIVVIVVNAARLLFQTVLDSLIRAGFASPEIPRAVAIVSGSHLCGTAMGTVLCGLVMHELSIYAGFLLSASASALVLMSILLISGIPLAARRSATLGYFKDFAIGLALFRNDRHILVVALLAVVALPIGQLSNALLSSFIRDDYGGGSDIFGVVDAAWPAGGILGTFLMGFLLKRYRFIRWEFYFAALLGGATVLFSFMAQPVTLIFVHGLMGCTSWCCKVLIDSRVLQICTNENVGRTKANIHVMISMSVIMMCFSPTVVKLDSTSHYFLVWGSIVFLSAMILRLSARSIATSKA